MINIPGNDYDDCPDPLSRPLVFLFPRRHIVNGDNVIQHQFISSAGDRNSPARGDLRSRFGRSNLHGTRQNNSTCLIWTDARKGIYDYENMISSSMGSA